MRLADLVATSNRIKDTRSRLGKVDLLADLLRRLEASEVAIGVAFLSGHPRQGRIGIGGSLLRAVMSAPSTRPEPSLFDAAPDAAERGTADALHLADVDQTFARITSVSGSGAAAGRKRELRELFARAGDEERDFLARLVLGEIRQGALAGIMADAVARAGDVPLAEIRRAAMLSGDLEAVAVATLTAGRTGLLPFRLTMFRPLQPMLAQPATDVADALGRLGTAAFEHKRAGARVQIHANGGDVRLYARQLNEVTASVPDVADVVRSLGIAEVILDGEVVAMDAGGRPHPFQVTMRRFGRTLDVARMIGELPLALTLFDVLRLDGADLIDTPARERWAILRHIAPALAVPQCITSDLSEANAFYAQALHRGHEGLMAKSPEAPYESGGRGFTWLKIKAVHALDLVVLAAEWGSGRRKGWLSNLHFGARDPASGGFVMLGKTFKGLTDEMLAWQTQEFQRLAARSEGHIVHVKPELVVEIAFNDVQESPRYPGGMALRLARVKAFRPDKCAEDADTIDTVREILRTGRKP